MTKRLDSPSTLRVSLMSNQRLATILELSSNFNRQIQGKTLSLLSSLELSRISFKEILDRAISSLDRTKLKTQTIQEAKTNKNSTSILANNPKTSKATRVDSRRLHSLNNNPRTPLSQNLHFLRSLSSKFKIINLVKTKTPFKITKLLHSTSHHNLEFKI